MDVIVIGAGLAGLGAAQRLAQRGHTVTLLEARYRLGGRVWTQWESGLSVPVELGPEWMGNSADIEQLLARRGGVLRPAQGRRYRRQGDRWENLDELPDITSEVLDRIRQLPGDDRSLRDALRECCDSPELEDASRILTAYVEGFDAADPDRVSVRWLAEVERNAPAEASQYRVPNGADRLVQALALDLEGRCELRLGSAAQEVAWKRGQVDVTLPGTPEVKVRGSAVVITAPLTVLDFAGDQPGGLRFAPALDEQANAARFIQLGPVVKLMLRFGEPFWRRVGPLDDMLFLHAFDQPIPTWWVSDNPDAPLLTAWAGGPQATRLGVTRGDALRDVAVESLAHALDLPVADIGAQLEAFYYHDWRADPFALGAYSYVTVGGNEAYRALSAPVEDTLFFAGEATCGHGENGTMDGALRSGWRAADEIEAIV